MICLGELPPNFSPSKISNCSCTSLSLWTAANPVTTWVKLQNFNNHRERERDRDRQRERERERQTEREREHSTKQETEKKEKEIKLLTAYGCHLNCRWVQMQQNNFS